MSDADARALVRAARSGALGGLSDADLNVIREAAGDVLSDRHRREQREGLVAVLGDAALVFLAPFEDRRDGRYVAFLPNRARARTWHKAGGMTYEDNGEARISSGCRRTYARFTQSTADGRVRIVSRRRVGAPGRRCVECHWT